MKRILFVLALVAFISVLAFGTPHTTKAALDATCSANPNTIGPFETTTITCAGFDRDTWVWIYHVEPDGTAVAECGLKHIKFEPNSPELAKSQCSRKTNEKGVISFEFANGSFPYFTRSPGKWTFVVEQLGVGGAKVHQGTTDLWITGGREGVSGALLTASTNTYYFGDNPVYATLGTFWLYGSGFAPNEYVSLWVEYPSPCSSHADVVFYSGNGQDFENYPHNGALHTEYHGEMKANESGAFTALVRVGYEACSGDYRFVARALGSGRGDDVVVTFLGNAVTANATVLPSKSIVNAMADTVWFYASGFGANETLSCWFTTPDGRALPIYQPPYVNTSIKTDGSGATAFVVHTGAVQETYTPKGFVFFDPLMSQGPLGQWAMSCRGDVTHRTGIGWFTMTGGTLDP